MTYVHIRISPKETHSHAQLRNSTPEYSIYDFSGLKYEQTLKRF